MKSYGIILSPNLEAAIVRDTDGRIAQGLAAGDIASQCQALLVVPVAGEWKASPTTGAGAQRFLRDDDTDALIAAVCSQLRGDGQTVVEVKYTDNLEIDAGYES